MEYIYENNILMMSVTKYVTYVVLYDSDDFKVEYEIKKFFCKEKYEQFISIKL